MWVPSSGKKKLILALTSDDITNPIEGICLPHTSATRQIQQIGGGKITLGALRNINLGKP